MAAIGEYRESRRWGTFVRSASPAAGAWFLTLILLLLLRYIYLRISLRIPSFLTGRKEQHASWIRIFEAPLLLVARLALGFGSGTHG